MALALAASCQRPGRDVMFILPDGYRGRFEIALDHKDGNAPPLVDGKWILRIPETGRLRLNTLDIFQSWHSQSAFYRSGQRIPMGYYQNCSPDDLACRSAGSYDNWLGMRVVAYVIGTENELEKDRRAVIADPDHTTLR
jgi:hypothetical protein